MSVSLCTQTRWPNLTIQVLNTRVCFLDIWYNSCTSVHSNLEHGLAILTESFSPLRSVLHNLSCWSPKQKWRGQATLSLILSTWHAYWASSHWFNLVPTNLNYWCKAHYMPSGKFHCCLVMLFINNLDADAMCQIPMMESSVVTAKSPLFYELTLMWYLATKLNADASARAS